MCEHPLDADVQVANLRHVRQRLVHEPLALAEAVQLLLAAVRLLLELANLRLQANGAALAR